MVHQSLQLSRLKIARTIKCSYQGISTNVVSCFVKRRDSIISISPFQSKPQSLSVI